MNKDVKIIVKKKRRVRPEKERLQECLDDSAKRLSNWTTEKKFSMPSKYSEVW